jgi:hypothetical protein
MSDAEIVPLHEQLVGKVRGTLMVLARRRGVSAALSRARTCQSAHRPHDHSERARSDCGSALGRAAAASLNSSSRKPACSQSSAARSASPSRRLAFAVVVDADDKYPRANEVSVSWPVMAFALGVSILTAVIMGLLTAWHGTKGDIRESLSASQRTQTGTALERDDSPLARRLTDGAHRGVARWRGAAWRSFLRLLEINPGYRTQHAVVLDATLPYERVPRLRPRRVAFYRELMSRLRAFLA